MDGVAVPEEFLRMLDRRPVRKLKKGWPLLFQGEAPKSAYVVKSGLIKVYDINANGDEKLISLADHLGILPLEWVFETSPVSIYYADAFTDCEVYSLPRQELVSFLYSTPEMLRFTLLRLVNLFTSAKLHISALEQTRAGEKLLRILQCLSFRFGKETKQGTMINIRLTHQDLAHMIGMTRETTAVELGKLRHKGVISYKRQHYFLDLEKLHQAMGDDTTIYK